MGQLDFSALDTMTEAEECRFMAAFTQALANDSSDVAKEHLASGRPIYFGDDRFPDAAVMRGRWWQFAVITDRWAG
ncbi:hypothetical protein [Magnetospirillum fulvum]|uniref:Uncharacterized protein n=1 Tax=Magnetospirillum fulvum MGU-K5 TaxID=1316936 RepID=S9S7H6_MAGFU|nr:hypothetical protein [Magnetospirillum fulvum]EPY01857.1 hypothetical protein K678_08786 [Magnetospirillum fulvum MGU-K5]